MHISYEYQRIFKAHCAPHALYRSKVFPHNFGIPNHPESSRYALSIAYHHALSSARANFIISCGECVRAYTMRRALRSTQPAWRARVSLDIQQSYRITAIGALARVESRIARTFGRPVTSPSGESSNRVPIRHL